MIQKLLIICFIIQILTIIRLHRKAKVITTWKYSLMSNELLIFKISLLSTSLLS